MNEPAERGLASRIRRFAVVGVLNTAIDLIVFAALVRLGSQPLLANVGAWVAAISFSYAANSRWSFERDANLPESRSILRFVSSGALISLGVSSAFIAGLSGLTGLWPAKLLGVVVAAILNFIAARWSIEDRVK